MSTDLDNAIQRPNWGLLYNTDCPPEDSCLPDEIGETIEVFFDFIREGTESSFTKPVDLFNFILNSEILNSKQISDLIAQSGFGPDFLFQKFGTYLDILCKELDLYPVNFVEEAIESFYKNPIVPTSTVSSLISLELQFKSQRNMKCIFSWITQNINGQYKAIAIIENLILKMYESEKIKRKSNKIILNQLLVIGAISSAFYQIPFES